MENDETLRMFTGMVMLMQAAAFPSDMNKSDFFKDDSIHCCCKGFKTKEEYENSVKNKWGVETGME